MSTSIDNRVVGLQFDNKNFEKNVGRTLNSLDKLEESLQLKGAGRGLEQLDRAASRMDFSKMGRATELITKRLSTMGIVGMNVLNRISNKAISTAERMLKAFTFQPIHEGFAEYELKMGSVQTIVASTGESLATVNAYLEELNKYSDKTIYSFKDMTASIGKFTNAGVPLEQAVLAIQGISNEAAVSGANAEEASRAMYNFSQALSAGYVKLIDWKSIENANMATREFKQELINTAVAMGTLKTANNGLYRAGNMTMNATKNFNDSLQKQWMTSEVLIETLRRYADETTDIGKKAFAAAQDIKTFHQLMDTIKESIGSGWAQISEIIFGDLEEAKELWTSIGNAMSNFVDNAFGGFTKFLKNNLQSNYKKFMSEGPLADVEKFNKDYKDAVDEQRKPIQDEIDANNRIIQSREFAMNELDKYRQRLKEKEKNGGWYINDQGAQQWWLPEPKAVEHSAEEVAALTKRNEELEKQMADDSIQADIFKKTLLKQFDEVSDRSKELLAEGFSRDEALKKMGITKEQFDKMMKWRNGIRDGTIDVEALVASFDEVARRKKIFNALGNTLKFVGSVFKPVTTAFKNVFFNAKNDDLWLGKLIDRWDKWAAGLKISDETMKKVTEAFEEMFGWVYKLGDWGIPKLKAAGKKLVGIIEASAISVYHFISAAIDFIDPVQMMNDALDWLAQKGQEVKQAFHDIWEELKQKPNIGPALTALQKVHDKFNYILDHDIVTEDGKVLTKGYQKFWYALQELPGWLDAAFSEAGVTVEAFVNDVKEYFEEASESSGTALDEIYNNIKEFVKKVADKVIKFGGWLKDNLGTIISAAYVTLVSYRILKFVSFLDSVLGSIEDFAKVIDNIGRAFKNAINRISKAIAFKQRAEGLRAFGEALKAVAEAILIISAAIYILSNIDHEKIGQGIAGVAAIIVALGLLAYVVHEFGDAKGAIAIGSLAGALLAVAYAAHLVTQIRVDDDAMGSTIGVLILMFSALGIMLGIISKMKVVSGESIKSAALVAVAVFALYAVLYAVKLISKIDMDWDTFISTAGKMGVAFLLLYGMMKILGKSTENMGKAGAGLLAMALSIILIIGAFKLIERMKPETILKGIVVLYLMFKTIGVFMDSVRGAGVNAHKAAAAILAIGLAIIPLAAAVHILSKIPFWKAAQGVFMLAGIMASLGLVMLMAQKFNASFKSLLGLVAVIATLGIVVGGLAVLAHFVGWENVIAGAGSLAIVFGVVAGAFAAILHFVGKSDWTSFGKLVANLGIMLIAVGAVAYIIYKLSTIENPDTAIQMAIVLGALIAEFTIVFAVCAGLGTVAPMALHGLLALDAVILNFGVLLGLFGLFDYLGATEFLQNGIPIFRAIGEGIGQFVGGMIGGVGVAVMEDVVKMTESLQTACTNISAASDALNVQDDFGSKLAGVAGALAAFTGADFLDTIKGWFQRKDDEDTFGKLKVTLTSLGEALKALDGAMGTTKLGNITTAGVAGEKLAGVVETLSTHNVDVTKMTQFAQGVKDFALALGVISRAEMTDVDLDKIEDIASAGERLVTMGTQVNSIDGIDGMWQKFWGKNDAATFGENIKGFATALNEIPEVTLADDVIGKITSAGTDLADMAKHINDVDNMDGMWQKFWGKNDASTFGTNIKEFVGAIQQASVKGTLIKPAGITVFDTNVGVLIDMVKNIQGLDINSLQTFSTSMDQFINWYKVLTIEGPDGATAALSAVMDSMISAIEDYVGQFKSAGSSSMWAYIRGLNDRSNNVKNAGINIAKEAVAGVQDNDQMNAFYNTGHAYVIKLQDGMWDHRGPLYETAKRVAKEALKGMQDGVGVTRVEEGSAKSIGNAYAAGLYSSSNEINDASREVIQASLQTMSDAIADINNIINSDIDIQPTIRPVLDLSDVEEGSRELDAMYNNGQVRAISNDIRKLNNAKFESSSTEPNSSTNVTFNQYNTSPKALSRIDIYRQTKNQISQISTMKGVVKTT